MSLRSIGRLAAPLLVALALGACGGGGSKSPDAGGPDPDPGSGGGGGGGSGGSGSGTTIPVTRPSCTPFGAPPRTLKAPLDSVFSPTCLPGGRRLASWNDADGTPRDACLFEPAQASTSNKLPLVIYLHPSVIGVDLSLSTSNIRAQLATADLTGDASRKGFLLLAPYGRVTDRFYPFLDGSQSPGWDNWYRQLGSGPRTVNGQSFAANVDASAIDHFLDTVVAEGKVDPKRIYLIGWSNGAAMAILYGLNRPRIAAAAVYSAPDPFEAFNDPCVQAPVTTAASNDTQLQLSNPQLPIYHLQNACDIAGICPNGQYLKETLTAGGATTIDDHIVDVLNQDKQQCLDSCGTDPKVVYGGTPDLLGTLQSFPGYSGGVLNHSTWPLLRTKDFFTYLRTHPLP